MRYIGNKTKLLPFIERIIQDTCGDITNSTMCDLFAGTGCVSGHFKNKVKKVISNDMEPYSHALCKNILGFIDKQRASEIIEILNEVEPMSGKFTENFSPAGHRERKFFTEFNASKIDGIREKIEEFEGEEYYFAMASLIEAADIVANTTGVYGAFLKKFNKRSSKPIVLKAILPKEGNVGVAFQKDSNELIKNIKGDILYLDPPYNSRQYGANYHILNYIVNYKNFTFREESKTALGDYNKSSYCSKRKALKEFEDLIRNCRFNNVFVSYNNEGLIKDYEFAEIMSGHGAYSCESFSHKRYKSNTSGKQKKDVTEYVHILKR